MLCPLLIPITDASTVGEARRAAARKSLEAELGKVEQGRVAIIATELATNLCKHARNGRLIIQVVDSPYGRAVEMLSIDSGPGISNVDRAFQDGFSTSGTPGNGLGAVRRMSTEFGVYSQQTRGTVIVSRVTDSDDPNSPIPVRTPSLPGVTWGGISLRIPGEDANGDTWRIQGHTSDSSIFVADGLGHGIAASEASSKAASSFESDPRDVPARCLEKCHQALVGTRGAAIAIARIHLEKGTIDYAGMGNISGSLFCGTENRGLCSMSGIVGVQMRSVKEFEYTFSGPGVLIMHSDGLQSRWNFEEYPGLISCHPAVIASVLLRDFTRGRDDVTVVVFRWNSFKAGMS